MIKPSSAALPFEYYQAYSRRTHQSEFIGQGSMIDLEMRRLTLNNDTFVFFNLATHKFANISSTFTFTSTDYHQTENVMCSDPELSVVDGVCIKVENLVLKESSKFDIALTDPFKDTQLSVGFYFCLKPTSNFVFFSLVGDNSDTIGLKTDTTGRLFLITSATHDLGAEIALGVWNYAIFKTDLTDTTGTKEVDIFIGT